MKVLNIILFFLFFTLLSSGCLKPGMRIAGQTDDNVSVNDNTRAVITSVLDAMIEAYRNKNTRDFMSYVSNDYAGDTGILEMAIQKDFSFFNNIELRYVLNTVSTDSNGKIYISLTYNRFLISSRNGESYTDHGTTAFVFHPTPGHPVVYSMKNPLLFGVSNASEVATGTVIASGNNSAIVVDDRGNLSIKTNDTSVNH